MAIAEGESAPDFTLPTDSDGDIGLKDFRGKKVILYFYPNDDTPGCTTEAVDFTAALPELEAANAVVIGISPNSLEQHAKFRRKHDLKVILASDPGHEMIERYGAWGEKMNYGRRSVGLIRSTVLIGEDGRIVRHWPKVRAKGHVAKVLEAVKAL